MINGGFIDGSTNEDFGSFKVGFAYLVNLIASSVDMAESLGMTKLVLAGLELGGVIGSLLGVAVLLLCVTLFVLAVDEYKANVDNMFAYMSGDESAGDAIVVNAGINIAVTAAFSGASYLAKNQLAKYVAKQLTDKLGEELAERLLKEGVDGTALVKTIRSLEKSGVDNALIRKAAGNLTSEEFDHIARLAKGGLAGELLEKVADNREILRKVSDSTLLLLRDSKSSAGDVITVLLRHGDEAGRLYGQYGDDVIEIALRYGDEGLEGIRRHGTDFLIEYFAYGDEFAQSYMKNGDKVLELVIKYSDDAMEGIRKYGDGFVVLYKSYGDEFVQNYFKYGDDAVDAYTKYGDNAAKVLAGGIGEIKFDIDEIRPQLRTEPDTAFFWSGKTDGVGGADVAAKIAKEKGGVTLESTIDAKGIIMPEWDFNNPSSMDAWDMASAAYAEQVSGEVRAVVGEELRPGNIWENVELPRLMKNPNVTKITIIDPKTGIETVIFER